MDSKRPIIISNQSIVNELTAYQDRPADALIEYVWNSFDANATRVEIQYSYESQVEGEGFGQPNLSIKDDGDGWDLSDLSSIEVFLDSKKRAYKKPYKSVPHGSKGVGRFTFYGFATSATWSTFSQGANYTLKLEREDISNYSLEHQNHAQSGRGTTVQFEVNSDKLHEGFFLTTLPHRILEKMAWFLTLYPDKQIYINDTKIEPTDFIDTELNDSIELDQSTIPLKMIKWKSSLADKENSKLYFLGADGKEVFKCPTGLNNKADIFYHSAFVQSELFNDYTPAGSVVDETDNSQASILDGDEVTKIVKAVKEEARRKLEDFRKPHIEASSEVLIEDWVKKDQYPKPETYGIDPVQYHDLVQQTFIVAPSLYLGISDEHRRVILNLMASLLSSSDRELIITILNQVYELSPKEKTSLKNILDRTTLKNVLSTIREVEHRLQVIEDLDKILNDSALYKETKEVEHVQRVLNDCFWIFGDEYNLVIDTEGSIRTAIKKWAKTMLEIEEFDPQSHSRKELDLLLSKKIEFGSERILNIVVELKRPSVKLGEKEYQQLSTYRDKLLEEPVCQGQNIEWIFILVGTDYDRSIQRKIESQKAWGESRKGLVEYVENENTKIYIRKWTEILNGEQRPRYRTLKDKLQLQLKDRDGQNVDEIVNSLASSEEKELSSGAKSSQDNDGKA